VIYLDYNATAPLKPTARGAMVDWLGRVGNASSVHGYGRAARQAIEAARISVSSMVGAEPAQVVFTSSGTEANNLALRGFPGRMVLASAVEHPSVLRLAATEIPVDRHGRLHLGELDRILVTADRPCLLSLMLANNETGVIQPVADATRIAHDHGALVHCDAVQAPGRVGLSMEELGVDLMSLSAHKLGGAQGVGALVLRPGVELNPLLIGGGQESGRRAGTENVAAVAAFGVAVLEMDGDLARVDRLGALRDRLEHDIVAIAPEVVVFGQAVARLPNTSCLAMPGVSAEIQLMSFDLAGIAISAGSACSSGKIGASHVLAAMGVAPDLARQAIRVSLGASTDDAAIDRFVQVWSDLYHRTRRAAS
jgi:cysteine desulfurase